MLVFCGQAFYFHDSYICWRTLLLTGKLLRHMKVNKMINTKRKLRHMTALLGTALFLSVTPAMAGFEWAPAPAPEKVMSAPRVIPTAPVNEMPAYQAIPVVMNAMTPAAPAMQEPVAPLLSPLAPVATVSPVMGVEIPPAQVKTYADIQGFGNDIPLVTAMSQIVPAGYAYSLDNKSKLGAPVSWSGGKPWNDALQSAVDPLGLIVIVTDNTVWLRNKESLSQPEPQAVANSFVEPMMVMPAASDVVPLSAPAMKNDIPMVSDNEPSPAYDAYTRRNPISMMMKADETVQAVHAPEVLSVAPSVNQAPTMAAPMAPPLMMNTPPPMMENMPSGMMSSPHMAAPQDLVPVSYGNQASAKLNPFEIRFWQAEKNASLRSVLTQWGTLSGTQIYWNSTYDYRLPVSLQTHATFSDAVTQILTAYEDMEPRPLGRLHPNLPNGQSILIIENYGVMK